MASSSKQKTTMAKLRREATLRERRLEKQERKQIRKQTQLDRADGLDIGLADLDSDLLEQVTEPV